MRSFALLEGLLVVGLAVALITKPPAKVPVMTWPEEPKPARALEPARELSSDACCRATTDASVVAVH